MKRIRLFEFGDQKWMPKIWRNYLHELLQFQVESIYSPIAPMITSWLRKNRVNHLTDLASGAGGPWSTLLPKIREKLIGFDLKLSDLHPKKKSPIPYTEHVVDLNCSETWPEGALCLFTAFHHLRQEEVDVFLRTIVKEERPVFIIEFTERSRKRILGMLFSPLVVWIHTIQLKRMTFGRFLFTYLLPIVPLIYLWDGIVSHLSSFTDKEFKKMAKKYSNSNYTFSAFQVSDRESKITLRGIYSEKCY